MNDGVKWLKTRSFLNEGPPAFKERVLGSSPSGLTNSIQEIMIQDQKLIAVGIVILLATLGACGTQQTSVDPNAIPTASYSSISKVILEPGCMSCHGGAGGYNFDSYSGTLQAVTAGNPSASALYTAIASGRMPKGASKLSDAQIQAVQDWITQGALNN